jgi:fatty acid elongase 2/fatty acid elongase 3
MSIEFSVDRPFGISLFEYFDKAYTTVVGQSAKEFTFVQGYTPLSTLPEGKKKKKKKNYIIVG